jgi:hypothetical protein
MVKASLAPSSPVRDGPLADDDGDDEVVGADVVEADGDPAAGGLAVGVLLPPQAVTRESRATGTTRVKCLICLR